VGAAFGAAAQLHASGDTRSAAALHDAASAAFFYGFQTSVLVAAAIALAGAATALVLIPSHPPTPVPREQHSDASASALGTL
jgi:hypothetical protein